MCGIAGSVNRDVDVNKIIAALHHRGPDAQEHCRYDNVHFVHTRLSVIDLVGGGQPMSRGELSICYNGEIYNHLALREQFGLHCSTGSDTETFLALYEKVGIACLEYLDGMFAIALYDAAKKELMLIRDRAGEKPLYYHQEGEYIDFASELNTLKVVCAPRIDDDSINQYLNTGFFYQKQTPYLGVLEVQPGHYLRIDTAQVKIVNHKWFSLYASPKNAANYHSNETSALAELDSALHAAVKNRLISSDLEVGCFLSGGIDSGLVTAIASSYSDKLKTFTVSFNDQFDEAPLAKSVAHRYRTEHLELAIDYQDLSQNIESILNGYGEPICDDSVIPSWYVSRAAKEHVTVVLTGDGADELFGGYRRYVPYAHLNLFNDNSNILHSLLSQFTRLPNPKNKMTLYNYMYRFADMLGRSGMQRFQSAMVNVSGTGLLNKEYNPDFISDFKAIAACDRSSLSKMMAMDFYSLMASSVLPKMDIASMTHALETRTPFFSNAVIGLSTRLPDDFKVRGKTTKYLLRELSKKYLPAQVAAAPKRGFETPLVDWVNGSLKEPIFDMLENGTYVSQFYESGYLPKLLKSKLEMTDLQRARTIWMLFTTEVWAQQQR